MLLFRVCAGTDERIYRASKNLKATQTVMPASESRRRMSDSSNNLKERVEEHRYTKEWHIPEAADFESARGLRVLEIGCGLGTDGAQFAKAGAIYTGVDLTDAAVELARKRFELFNLPGEFRTADAENLDFADNSFDLVYSHGVLHHTPDTVRAVKEVYR